MSFYVNPLLLIRHYASAHSLNNTSCFVLCVSMCEYDSVCLCVCVSVCFGVGCAFEVAADVEDADDSRYRGSVAVARGLAVVVGPS